ncbi:MAG TPA: DUF1573 domain-containing protein [Chitinophagaceae bacterium]|nr:DUF1573 domain-containing protein [Chitinophagaceae bacterium]
MKKLFLLSALSFICFAVFAQSKAEDVVKFPELVHDFGKIKQGVPTTFDFEFKNVSEKPVVVANASASCGCTTPKWPQAPVMAGKTEKINVGYNAANVGAFSKTITVKLAGVDSPVTLTISGEVLTSEAYDAYVKENASKGKSKGKSGK